MKAPTKIAVGAVALALTLMGCSSGSTPTADSAKEPASDCAKQAQQVVDKWTKPVELVGPSENVDMASIAGKEVYLLLTVTNQFSAAISDGFKAAADAAGLKPVIFDGKGTVTEWNRGLDQAVAAKPAGIVLWGIPPELVEAGVKKAKAEQIPVFDSVNGSVTDPLQDGIAAHVDVDAQEWGAVLANWWLAESNCKANVGVIWPPAFGGLNKIALSAKKTLSDECPTCKFVSADMDVANMATTLPEQARTMLTSNPDMNFFTTLFDSSVTYVAPVVSQFKGVQIGSHDGITTSLDMVRKGGPQTMDMTYPPSEYLGWMYVSLLGNLATGQEPDKALLRIPERLVTTKTIPATNAEIWASFDGYEDVFKKAWGK